MPRYDLAAMFRRARNPRRRSIPLRPIVAPATQATNLYQAAYRDIVRTWEAGLPMILATYERSLAQMQTDSPADVMAQVSAVEAENTSVLLTVRARLERWARILEQWHRRKWRAAVLSATTVDVGTMIGPADARLTLEAAIERNVALVRSISDQARQRIADAVLRGLTNRTPAREVAAELREAVGMARDRALRVASDQTVKITSALNDERRRQAGIMAWEWVHSAKRHPRLDHVARNGRLYADDPALVGQQEGGKRVGAPPEDRPGALPFCGCTARAVLIL